MNPLLFNQGLMMQAFLGASSKDLLLVLIAVLVVILCVVLWAIFFRETKHESYSLPDTSSHRSSRGHSRKRRKRRREHRPRNPTRAETGGLPHRQGEDAPSS